MERYGQLVYRYLKNNKKRTVSTILGVVMGAFLIFAVLNIVFCNIASGLDNARKIYNFDAVFYNLSPSGVKTIQNYPGVDKSYTGGFQEKLGKDMGIVFVDDFYDNPYDIVLKEGRYPENKNEIIVNAFSEDAIGDFVGISADDVGVRDDIELEIVGTFEFEGDYDEISPYEYSYIAYIGRASDMPGYFSAVYVRYENSYMLIKNTEKIAEATGSDFYINDSIGYYYNQTSEGSYQAVNVSIVFALVLIIACMAATVIKNTLRLSVTERMRDYGVLRCAGASLKQLKYMIRKEAFIIGTASSVVGIVLSYVAQVIYSNVSDKYDFTHFYILAGLITVFVCIITMLISSIEPCSIIKRLTPVEAVRNYMKVSDREKIKVRKARLITKLFGICGSYAYKNVVKNPKQFVTRVVSLTIGIVVFTCTQTLCDSVINSWEQITGMKDGYYNVVIDADYMNVGEDETPDMNEFCKNRDIIVSEIEKLPEIRDSISKVNIAETSYDGGYCMADIIEGKNIKERYTEEYINSGTRYFPSSMEEDEKAYLTQGLYLNNSISSYDADMFYMYEPYLIDGTCDVSELGDDGIILYNKVTVEEEVDDTGITYLKQIDFMNYKVGDTVSFVAAPKDVYDKKYEEIVDKYYELYKDEDEYKGLDDVKMWIESSNRTKILYDTYSELYNEGYVKTYTIKGIVDENALFGCYNMSTFIMTNDQFKDFMPGWDEDASVGMWACHADGYDADVYNILEKNNGCSMYYECAEFIKMVYATKKTCNIILIIILLFMTINIFNNTSSSMVFRKGEFALLRCVGMSKKKLTYMVMLEGLFAAIFASFIGTGISIVAVLIMKKYMLYLGYVVIDIPYGKVIFAILLLFAVMSLASWIPLQSIKKEIAPALAEADE
ncbi:MAG: FtsX-like permease family protein [Coprococcus sp.]